MSPCSRSRSPVHLSARPSRPAHGAITRRQGLLCLAAGAAATTPMGVQAWNLGDLWPTVGSGRVTVQHSTPGPIQGVAVHDAMSVRVFEGEQHLFHDGRGPAPRHGAVALEATTERLAFEELHHEIGGP